MLFRSSNLSNTKELGRLIYTEYVYPFEIAAVILLVAIVAAIALTLRKRKLDKYMDPATQIAVQRKDRVRVVSMASEARLDADSAASAEKPADATARKESKPA